MNKVAIGLLVAGSLLSPFVAFADDDVIVHGAADPNSVQQAWGLTGYQTPNVAGGAIITDQHAFSVTCPDWFPKQALGTCQDITGTSYYADRMMANAMSLVNYFGSAQAASAAAPALAGWISVVAH